MTTQKNDPDCGVAVGNYGFTVCGVSCEHLPLQASRTSSSFAIDSSIATAVAGGHHSVGFCILKPV